MAMTYRLAVGGMALALAGCAMLGGGTPTAQAPGTTSMGGSPTAAGFVRTGQEPFSLANCMKFDALPQECERNLPRAP